MENRNEIIERIKRVCPNAVVMTDEPMNRHTTFRVGGPADLVIAPSSPEEAVCAILETQRLGISPFVMGNGSNLLVKDGGMEGVVVLLGERMAEVRREDNRIYADAGAMLSRVSREALDASLCGMVFASGIPGTVGGAVVMNAGAYGGEIKDILVRALVLSGGECRWMTKEELQMGYRTTLPLKTRSVVLQAEFELEPGDREELLAETAELSRKRREKQPLNLPSAGSTFKRPDGYFAGALIEQANMKGASVGGAQVSTLHAGFIVNTGNATARDILSLIEQVQTAVYRTSGVLLEPEVRIVGRD